MINYLLFLHNNTIVYDKKLDTEQEMIFVCGLNVIYDLAEQFRLSFVLRFIAHSNLHISVNLNINAKGDIRNITLGYFIHKPVFRNKWLL